MAIPMIIVSGSAFPPGLKITQSAVYDIGLARLSGFYDTVISNSYGLYTTSSVSASVTYSYTFVVINQNIYKYLLETYPFTHSVTMSMYDYTASFDSSSYSGAITGANWSGGFSASFNTNSYSPFIPWSL